MAFASNKSINFTHQCKTNNKLYKFLFNEELGAVFAINKTKIKIFNNLCKKYNIDKHTYQLGQIRYNENPTLKIKQLGILCKISALRKCFS